MKTLLKIFAFILISLKTFGQPGVEISLNDEDIVIVNGTYIKDIDNVFQHYIGTWEGTWNNKKMSIQFIKNIKQVHSYPNGDYFYRDELVGKYLITDLATGQVLNSTMNITNLENTKIQFMGLHINGDFSFYFIDTDNCNLETEGVLRDIPNIPNQLQFINYYIDYNSKNCPYTTVTDIPIFIPVGTGIVITKQ